LCSHPCSRAQEPSLEAEVDGQKDRSRQAEGEDLPQLPWPGDVDQVHAEHGAYERWDRHDGRDGCHQPHGPVHVMG